jgi:septal ring factor EnvC (AmiA/AmiB activator)
VNRSILIVICDFIVLSVLSLNFGVGSGQMLNSSGGGGMVMNEITAKKIIRELKWRRGQLIASARKLRAANKRIGYLEKRQKELELIEIELSKTRRSLKVLEGDHDPEDVDRKLKEEIARSSKLSASLLSMRKEFDFISERYRKASQALGTARDELSDTKRLLSERKNQLQIVSRELNYTKDKLQTTKKSLDQAFGKLNLTEKDLQKTRKNLDKTSQELSSVKNVHSKTTNVLSFTKGQLNSTEKQLTETKQQLGKTSDKLMQASIDLVGARKKLESMQVMLKSAVSELSSTKRNLSTTKNELTSTKTSLGSTTTNLVKTSTELEKIQAQIKNTSSTLNETKKQLSEARKKLQNNALKNYSSAVVKLLFSVREKRLLRDYRYGTEWYQPIVKIGSKNYLVVNFSEITGLDQPITGHADIINLKYRIAPTTGDDETRITSMIEPLETDPRVCAIVINPPKNVKPLQPLTYSQLRKRGIQNLYLFKNGSFGKKSSVLNGRVSMNLDGKDPYLYIRNSARTSDSELKADAGDCVITKQGDFVGIVVHTSKPNPNHQQIAKCFIFPDNLRFDPEFAIPVTRTPGSEYYNNYLKQVDAVRRLIKRRQR